MAATSINIQGIKPGSEIHNCRKKELDYVRPELSHLNEHWTADDISGRLESAKTRYFRTTGQRMQEKATPIREGVAVISDRTTMQQLQHFCRKAEERFGIKAFQIHIHRDEGYMNAREWKPNLHAHIVFDWTQTNGKSIRLNRQDMAGMQTLLAECLDMERGVSSDRAHLNAIQYKTVKEAGRVMELENRAKRVEQVTAHLPELEEEYREVQERHEMAREELTRTEEQLRTLKKDIRNTEVKKSAAKAGKAIFEATERLFSSRAINSMQKQIEALRGENKAIKQDAAFRINRAQNETGQIRREMEKETSELKEELKTVQKYFPTLENVGRNTRQLRKMGVPDEHIPGLLLGRELTYSGNLYDTEHRHSHQVENVSIRIIGSAKGGMSVWLNRKSVTEFFRELWNVLQRGLNRGRGFYT